MFTDFRDTGFHISLGHTYYCCIYVMTWDTVTQVTFVRIYILHGIDMELSCIYAIFKSVNKSSNTNLKTEFGDTVGIFPFLGCQCMYGMIKTTFSTGTYVNENDVMFNAWCILLKLFIKFYWTLWYRFMVYSRPRWQLSSSIAYVEAAPIYAIGDTVVVKKQQFLYQCLCILCVQFGMRIW